VGQFLHGELTLYDSEWIPDDIKLLARNYYYY